jgi:aryl-alcohol dehydrogenase-like predicted oxidoreductase
VLAAENGGTLPVSQLKRGPLQHRVRGYQKGVSMETRQLGRTGHLSSVAILGGVVFAHTTQAEADALMERVIAAGVNHIDVAPSYGEAELRLGPWLARERGRFFLGCKTQERSRAGAAAELRRSLARLQVVAFDLFQLHAVTSLAELDAATQPGGALEALAAARDEGLTRFVGITAHSAEAPAVIREALRRFDFDTVMFPVNYVQYTNPAYRQAAETLISECQARNVGVMAIKALARGPWAAQAHTHHTWYEPFSKPASIQPAVNFALSQPLTGVCTAGDPQLLPLQLEACETYRKLSAAEQDALISSAEEIEPLFA